MHFVFVILCFKGVGILEGLPSPFQAARYHSLVIDKVRERLILQLYRLDGICRVDYEAGCQRKR